MSREKCVLYTRSSKGTHDISPAAQRADLREYARRKGYQIVGDYSDAAVSANANPPKLAEMLQAMGDRKREWNVILAVESSRLARDVDLAGVISYQVRKADCRIEYSKQPKSDNPAMDMMRDQLMRAFDMYHSMLSKTKGLQGMRENAVQGHRAGGRAPLGYLLEYTPTGAIRHGEQVTKSKLVPDPEWAPSVRKFLELRAEGEPRYKASQRSGLKRSVTTLIGIERNALVYAGITVWNRHVDKKQRSGRERYRPREAWVLQPGTHEAFISESDAEKIMKAALPRPERLTRRPGAATLLGGFLFTPEDKTFTASGDGYYRAGKGRRIPAAALESVVREVMNEEVDSHEFTQRFVAELKREAGAASE